MVGDKRKYLTCLVTLKCKVDDSGLQTNILEDNVSKICQKITNTPIKTIEDFISNSNLTDMIHQAINSANSKAESNPQKVQKFKILPLDLSIGGGELGPTLKVKRHYIMQKYSDEIDSMYVKM